MTLESLRRIHDSGPCELTLGEDSWARIAYSRRVLDDIAYSGRTVYGVNTGFGKLAQTRIPECREKWLESLARSGFPADLKSGGEAKPRRQRGIRLPLEGEYM